MSRAFEPVNRTKAYIQVTGRIGAGPLALRVVPGLDDPKGYSFVAPDGRHRRHRDFLIRFDANDGTALFRRDATFHSRRGTAGGSVRLESVNYPGRFVRHSDDRLRLDKGEDTALFRADSSFRPVTPS